MMPKMMSSCKEVVRLSSKSLDAKLSLREKIALMFHNFMCPFCKGYTKEMKRLMAMVRNKKRVSEEEIHRALTSEQKARLKEKVAKQIADS